MPPAPGQEEPLERLDKIVNAMMSHKDADPFREPVDWRGLELFDYLEHVSKPMDLGTIKRKLERGQYKTAHECAEDVRLVWSNCQAYNADGSDFWLLAKSFARRFEDRYRNVRKEFDVGQPVQKKRKSSSASRKKRARKEEDTSEEEDEESEEESEEEDHEEESDDEKEEESDEEDSEEEEEKGRASKRAKRRGSASSGRATPTNSGTTASIDDRAKFGMNLFLLSGKELGHVMTQLELECPAALESLCTSQFGDSSMEINVDAIPVDLFNTLNTYVNTKTHGKGSRETALGGAAPSKNIKAAPPAPARRGPGRPKKS